ncbi:MAG: DNA-3-methyladenine glycosylase I [Gammaproteobacteria bacterium]|nr:DNA-3-methyladenine glycosylase I [Gammaproteobacteria bacterium]
MSEDNVNRCDWALGVNQRYLDYHDLEWGMPQRDDQVQFEFLVLESAQAGLSWAIVLNKRDGYRQAFRNFDVETVARFNSRSVERLVNDASIVRNRQKIEAAINNARRFIEVQEEFGSFSDYIWGFVDGEPIVNRWRTMEEVPATSAQSDKLARDLVQRGFRFVGSTIIYAHMQATGLVNDHTVDCFRHLQCQESE